MPKTTVRDPPRTNGWTFAHCPSSSEWRPGGNTGEIKAARKETGHPTSKSRWLRTSVLFNKHSPTYGSYMGLTFTLHASCWIKYVLSSGGASRCEVGGVEEIGGLDVKPAGKFQKPRPLNLRETPFLYCTVDDRTMK